MDDIIAKLQNLLEKSVLKCDANCIALSGGLDSTIIASHFNEKKPKAITIITQDFLATDLTYCQLVSNEFNLDLEIKTVDTQQVLEAIEKTIKILGIFNDIEIRNSVVIYLVLEEAKKSGFSKIITGDGADELFAGYNFLQNKSKDELEKDLDRIWSIMHFPSKKLGKELGIEIQTPFLEEKFAEFAKTIPAKLKVKEENDKIYGKWILRKAFEKKIPRAITWREKSPMQEGAGTAKLTDMFNAIIQDDSFEDSKQEINKADDVIIRTKESLHYYKLFRKYFDAPSSLHKSSSVCPFCKYLVEENSKFCRMCGAFPI